MRAKCGSGEAAWVTGVLAVPGTQGSLQLGKQEIECSKRIWKPVLANTLQYSCLENPPPWQRSLEGHSLQDHKESDTTEVTCVHRHKTFFACGYSAPVRVEREDGSAALLSGILETPSVQGYGLPLPQELWPYQCLFWSFLYLVIRRPLWPVFLYSSTHSALRGLLGSFSVVLHIMHIERPSLAGVLSVVQCVKC